MLVDDERIRRLVARAAALSARWTAEGVPAEEQRARLVAALGPADTPRVLAATAPDDQRRREALLALVEVRRFEERLARVEPGAAPLAPACARCGAARAAADRYCAACGAPLDEPAGGERPAGDGDQ